MPKTRWRSRSQHLHFIATGDQLPDRTPDWFWEWWPSGLLNRIVCWRYGHDLDTQDGITFCIWCPWTETDDAQ